MNKLLAAFLASVAILAVGQVGVRTAVVTSPTVGDGVTQVATYRYSDHAAANDAGVRIQWLQIVGTTNIAITRVAYDGAYTNDVLSIDLSEETTTNVYDYAGSTFGVWPATDLIVFTGTDTNFSFTARMGLVVTQRIP